MMDSATPSATTTMVESGHDDLGDLFGDPGFKSRAYSAYARARREQPVSFTELPSGRKIWFISRYDDALMALRDTNRFANDITNVHTDDEIADMFQSSEELGEDVTEKMTVVDENISRHLLNVDAPDHSRLRKLVSQSFTPRYVEALRPRVQTVSRELLDTIEDRARRTGRREFELIDDYAYPLPLTVIAEMLGIPLEDRGRFQEWSHAAVSFNPSMVGDAEINDLLYEFVRYMQRLVAQKRENPGDDITTGLVEAESEGDRLSEQELIAMIFLLIVAGHETTVNLIGNGVLALLDHPDQLALLQTDPGLMKNAVEEMLRFTGPVEHSLARWAREDIAIDGAIIPCGDQVMVLLASADRDDGQFPDAARFDITRTPGRHLAFGMGIHVCLGAPLARIEGETAFTDLLHRLPDLHLAAPRHEITWRAGSLMRGVDRLPIAY